MHFSDSEDEAKDPGEVFFDKAEAKVMTRSEYAKAEIAPPPASKAPYPKNRRSRSLSPKPTSQSTLKVQSRRPRFLFLQKLHTKSLRDMDIKSIS